MLADGKPLTEAKLASFQNAPGEYGQFPGGRPVEIFLIGFITDG